MSTKISLTKEAFILMIGKSLAMLFNIFLPIVLVRLLTKSEFGLYKQFLLVFFFSTIFIQLALKSSLYYYFYRGENRDKLITNTITLIFVCGSTCALVLNFIPHVLGGAVALENYSQFVLLASLYCIFQTIAEIWDDIFILEKKPKYAAARNSIFAILDTFVVLILVYCYRSVMVAFWGLVLMSFVKFICFSLHLHKNYKFSYRNFSKSLLIKQIKYSFPLFINSICGALFGRGDRLAVSLFFPTSTFAIYSVGTTQVPVVKIFRQSITNLLSRVFAERHSVQEFDKILLIWHNSIRKLGIVLVGVCALLSSVSVELITFFFTDNYIGSAGIFSIFILQIPLQAFTGLDAILRAFNENYFLLRNSIFFIIINIFLMVLFSHFYGLIGLAIAVTLTKYLSILNKIHRVKNIFSLKIKDILPWNDIFLIFFSSLVSIVVIYQVKLIVDIKIVKIIGSFFIFCALYFPQIYFYKVIRANEKKILRELFISMLDKRKWKIKG